MKLKIQLFGDIGPVGPGGQGVPEVDTSLPSVSYAYLQLYGMCQDIQDVSTALSGIDTLDGVASNGEYTQALECVNGLNGYAGFGKSLNDALTQAKNVMQQIIIAEGGSQDAFDLYLSVLEGLYLDVKEFGEDITSLIHSGDELMDLFTLGILQGVGDLIPGVGDGFMDALIGGSYQMLLACITNGGHLMDALKNATPAALSAMSKALQRSFSTKYGYTVNLWIDVGLGLLPYMFKDGLKSIDAKTFLEIVVYAAVSNTGVDVLSPTAAAILSAYASGAFLDENGNVQEDWCWAAAFGILGGNIAGDIIGGYTDVSGIVGAVLGYLYMAIAANIDHEEYEDFRDRMQNIG